MSDSLNARRQPDLYWKQLVQLKAASICIRLYRNQMTRRVRVVELIKAVGSSGGIAAWVVWKDLPFLWSGIIAAAQLLDATKHIFPFARQHKAASDPGRWPLNCSVSTQGPNGRASMRAASRPKNPQEGMVLKGQEPAW